MPQSLYLKWPELDRRLDLAPNGDPAVDPPCPLLFLFPYSFTGHGSCNNRKKSEEDKAQLEQQKKSEVHKDSENQSLRVDIQYLKTELEKQKLDGVNKESDIQQLRADLQALRAELEIQKKNQVDNQSRAVIEGQRKLLDGDVKPHNCTVAKSNGIHKILIPNLTTQPVEVVCDACTRGGGWTIILRRLDGSVNFYRNWTDYKNGFGDLEGEFFLGLDKIHALTEERRHELLVVLEDFEGDERYELYNDFAIGNENRRYVLHTLGDASGTAGDSFSGNRGSKFNTFDDESLSSCPKSYSGAWWYAANCGYSNLAGTYKDNESGKGVNWHKFRGFQYSLKRALMMIRPLK
ncbi:microfibril-associated glycoprotein 4-like [Drosophila innubila]|uniref:microfibril-associated glycoprotein 4-like n=1 Tax=Drosophila innubila TaxID=198719 RepID=UPI00148D26D2|nr:microfibril-associated glycoprotein 4-like [Drosophila innubila]